MSRVLQVLSASKIENRKLSVKSELLKKKLKVKQQTIRRVSKKIETLKENQSNLEGMLQNTTEIIEAQTSLLTEMSKKLESYYQAFLTKKYSQEISISMGQPMPSFETTKFKKFSRIEGF